MQFAPAPSSELKTRTLIAEKGTSFILWPWITQTNY